MGIYHDKHAKENLKYLVGDLFMVNGKDLKTRRPSRKLHSKLVGPFKVSKVLLSIDFDLELPSRWSIHTPFLVSHIESYRFTNNSVRPLHILAVEANKIGYDVNCYDYETSYTVEKIVGSQYSKVCKQV
jgi:hypothetical protein